MKLINGGTLFTTYDEFVASVRLREEAEIASFVKLLAFARAGKPVGFKNQVTLGFTTVSVEEIITRINNLESKRYDVQAPNNKILEELLDFLVSKSWAFPEIGLGKPEDDSEDGNIFMSFYNGSHEIVFRVHDARISSMSYEYATDKEEECLGLTVEDVQQKIASFFEKDTVFSSDMERFGVQSEPEEDVSEVIAKMLKDLL